MALNMDGDTPEVKKSGTAEQPKVAQDMSAKAGVLQLGFGDIENFVTISTEGASEVTKKVADSLEEIYKNIKTPFETKVLTLDKQVYTQLAYTTIVVSAKRENSVAYYMLLLEISGRKPLTSSQIVDELSVLAKTPGRLQGFGNVYVASDAIDDVLNNIVLGKLQQTFKGCEFSNVDAMVIPYQLTDITPATFSNVAATAYNACAIELAKQAQIFNDINIVQSMSAKQVELKIESNVYKQTLKDYVGRPIRADWVTSLLAGTTQRNLQSLNMNTARKMVTQSTGFIEAIPEEIPVANQQPGVLAQSVIRFRPNIIIDSIKVQHPTTGFALLSILSSMVMIKPNMYMALLAPSTSGGTGSNVGVLNIAANLEGNANGIGEPLDLADPKMDSNEVYNILSKLFTLEPIVSMDVDIYGPETHYTSVFGIAASPGHNAKEAELKTEAAKEIIETAVWLTNGSFPKNFDTNSIFATNGVVIPTGRWIDKDGNEKDIREIGYVEIAEYTNGDIAVMNRWAQSNFPNSGIDSFSTKVEIINQFIPSAEISGKADRLIFSGLFLNELMAAATKAGFNVTYDPAITLTQTANIASFSNDLRMAAVDGSSMSFTPYGGQGNTYSTPYTSAGIFRNFQ